LETGTSDVGDKWNGFAMECPWSLRDLFFLRELSTIELRVRTMGGASLWCKGKTFSLFCSYPLYRIDWMKKGI
jgi:hypothetical protein